MEESLVALPKQQTLKLIEEKKNVRELQQMKTIFEKYIGVHHYIPKEKFNSSVCKSQKNSCILAITVCGEYKNA